MTRAERLQLQAAKQRLDDIWPTVPADLRADIAYTAARLEKVLSGHASYR